MVYARVTGTDHDGSDTLRNAVPRGRAVRSCSGGTRRQLTSVMRARARATEVRWAVSWNVRRYSPRPAPASVPLKARTPRLHDHDRLTYRAGVSCVSGVAAAGSAALQHGVGRQWVRHCRHRCSARSTPRTRIVSRPVPPRSARRGLAHASCFCIIMLPSGAAIRRFAMQQSASAARTVGGRTRCGRRRLGLHCARPW